MRKVIKRNTATGHVMAEIDLAGPEGIDTSDLLPVYLAYSAENDIPTARQKLNLSLRRHAQAGNLEVLGRRERQGRATIWRMTAQGRAAFVGKEHRVTGYVWAPGMPLPHERQ